MVVHGAPLWLKYIITCLMHEKVYRSMKLQTMHFWRVCSPSHTQRESKEVCVCVCVSCPSDKKPEVKKVPPERPESLPQRAEEKGSTTCAKNLNLCQFTLTRLSSRSSGASWCWCLLRSGCYNMCVRVRETNSLSVRVTLHWWNSAKHSFISH